MSYFSTKYLIVATKHCVICVFFPILAWLQDMKSLISAFDFNIQDIDVILINFQCIVKVVNTLMVMFASSLI